MNQEPENVEDLLDWVENKLYSYAPQELLLLMDRIEALESGELDEHFTLSQKVEMLEKLNSEVVEWKKFLF